MARSSAENHWLRFAMGSSRAPGLLTIVSLLLGTVALLDYAVTYLHKGLDAANIAFCIIGVVSILIGIGAYRHEQTTLFKHAELKLNNTISTPFNPAKRILMPPDYAGSGYVIFEGMHGKGLWSPEVSVKLFDGSRSGSLAGTISIRHGYFKGSDDLRRSVGAKEALSAVRAGKLFRNDRKIRLCSDILLDVGSGRDMELQETDYLASRSSNDIAFRRVDVRGPGLDHPEEARIDRLYDGTSFFLKDSPKSFVFRGYEDSECSNQIGVSTLAITSDGWLMLVDQLKGGIESPDLIAPSGSGSLDWSDLPSHRDGANFWSWVVEASARELREELGLSVDKLPFPFRLRHRDQVKRLESIEVKSVLVGFGGLLHRSGKPEFLLLSKLGCTLNELRDRSIYGKEERFLSQRCQVTAKQKLESFSATAVLELIKRNQSSRDSFPLELCYRMIAELCSSRRNELEEFLNAEDSRGQYT